MKQIKNVTLAVLAGLLILSVATVSCGKKSGGGGTATPTIGGITPSSSDTVGQVIVITGTNFTSSSTVTIGGIAVTSVTFTSSTSLTVTIPVGVAVGTAVPVIVTTGSTASTPSNISVILGIGAFKTADGKSSSNQVEAASLIGYWPFDGSTTESTTGSAPTLSGGTTTFVAGKIGQAAHFANSWLTYPTLATAAGIATGGTSPNFNNDTLQNGFTVSLWIQVPDTSSLTTAFALYCPNLGNYPIMGILYHKHPGAFGIDAGVGSAQSPTVDYTDFNAPDTYHFNDSLTWAFIALVYDTTGHNIYYYANNVKIATISLAVSAGLDPTQPILMPTPNYATFGTDGGLGTTPGNSTALAGYMANGLTGNIDDARFYNKTLTATDLDDLYQLGNHGQ